MVLLKIIEKIQVTLTLRDVQMIIQVTKLYPIFT